MKKTKEVETIPAPPFLRLASALGIAFAGYGADNPLVNITGGLAMLLACYWVVTEGGYS